MSNFEDSVFSGSIIGMLLGFPILIGIGILAIPFVIISCITDVPMGILLQNLVVFAIAVFLVWLFSGYQIIENGIVGLIVGTVVHKNFEWHTLACIILGVGVVGFLFAMSRVKAGLFPLSDKVWKIFFIIAFFLENVLIRCDIACDKGFLLDKYESNSVHRENQIGATMGSNVHNEDQTIDREKIEKKYPSISQSGGTNEEPRSEEVSEDIDYLMEHLEQFSQRKKFWDSKNGDKDIEEKAYRILKAFIDDAYIVLPHVAFREIFWWDWHANEWKLTDRVTKMHFDFGIYNEDMQPIFFLELHGKDHKTDPDVIKRDKFKAELAKHCRLKLITFDCSESMTDAQVRDRLVARIKEEIPDRKSCPTYCPNCRSLGKNNLMKIKARLNGSGYFYGCSTYNTNVPKECWCPVVNIADVAPLYMRIPRVKGE